MPKPNPPGTPGTPGPTGPPASPDTQAQKSVWQRRWPRLTLFSGVGVILLAAAIAWTWYEDFRRFPPDRADPDALALPLPDRPSAVVLPFVAASEVDSDRLLAARITEDLTRALAARPDLFLIAPETGERLGGGQFRIKETSEGTGVRHLIAGSLGRQGTERRVFVQLIDAFAGEALWASDYVLPPEDLHRLRDRLLPPLLEALDVEGAHENTAPPGPERYSGWIGLARAVSWRDPADRESMAESVAALQTVEQSEPHWPEVPAAIAEARFLMAQRGWDKAANIQAGLAATERLQARDPTDPRIPGLRADFLTLSGAEAGSKILDLRREAARRGPNDFPAHWALAEALIAAGQPRDALAAMDHALRLHPRHPVALDLRHAGLQIAAGETARALTSLEAVIAKRPAAEGPRLMRVFILKTLKQSDAAREEIEALTTLHPGFRLADWAARQRQRGRPDWPDWHDVLRRAGVPD